MCVFSCVCVCVCVCERETEGAGREWGGVVGGVRLRGVLGSCLLSFDADSRIYGLILSLASSACPSHLHAGPAVGVCLTFSECVCVCVRARACVSF